MTQTIEQPAAKRCGWDKAWIGPCHEPAGPSGMCEKHAGNKCASCGKLAVRDCDHTGIQFVCGAPLCADCEHGVPPRDNPGWFALGGGHHPRAVVEEQSRAMYAEMDAEAAARTKRA